MSWGIGRTESVHQDRGWLRGREVKVKGKGKNSRVERVERVEGEGIVVSGYRQVVSGW